MAFTAGNLKNVYSFSKEQIADFKMQFDAYDEDKSGTVEKHELKSVLEKCGMPTTDQQVEEMVKEFDEDNSGNLDFQEFVSMMCVCCSATLRDPSPLALWQRSAAC